MNVQTVTGNIVDISGRRVYCGTVEIVNGKIKRLIPDHAAAGVNPRMPYILPGFIDSHVHIESSMLIPSEFARLAVVHGTVATVSDPHEIANVCGLEGVDFMIANGAKVPFKFNFGAPSCVPATVFETAGDSLDAKAVASLLERPEIRYLSEMMNFPGVLNGDAEVLKKIAAAHSAGKPVDGHAPGLRGDTARNYIAAGISTDHECFTLEEALDKIQYGMKIIIREGSAARNFEALAPLLQDYPDQVLFCSDDKHPDSLVEGHINLLCQRAVAKGLPLFHILQAACINPVQHYKLPVGQLREGDPADFIVVEELTCFQVLQTYIDGVLVADQGKSLIRSVAAGQLNRFQCNPKNAADFRYPIDAGKENREIAVIECLDGQLITNRLLAVPKVEDGAAISDVDRDLLKITVVNRYREAPPAIAFIKNFGLKNGAIASSVAHDSHNIVAVGTDDEVLARAVNLVIEAKGGVSCISGNTESVLPLPVAGLMSGSDGYAVAEAYTAIDAAAKKAGSTLQAPFMTLSFMALLVIPKMKLSDKGLFDGESFRLIDID